MVPTQSDAPNRGYARRQPQRVPLLTMNRTLDSVRVIAVREERPCRRRRNSYISDNVRAGGIFCAETLASARTADVDFDPKLRRAQM